MLESSRDGLSDSDAGKRLDIFGSNEISEKKTNPFLDFLLRYWGPMPWLLELAMALSFILRHYLEGVIIFLLLTINAVIGHVHSRGSQKAVKLLKKKLAVKAKVLRDKKWAMMESKELVPGDIITVGLGDIVPADSKIISGELSIDQSALTGASLPAETHESDIVYSSSVVRRGEAGCRNSQYRRQHILWQDSGACQNGKAKVTSGRCDDGYCQIHDVSGCGSTGADFSIRSDDEA